MQYLFFITIIFIFTSTSLEAGSSSIGYLNEDPSSVVKSAAPQVAGSHFDARVPFKPLSPQKPGHPHSKYSDTDSYSAASQHSRSSKGSDGAISVAPVEHGSSSAAAGARAAGANPAPVRRSHPLHAAARAGNAMEEDEAPASLAASAAPPAHAPLLVAAVAAPIPVLVPAQQLPLPAAAAAGAGAAMAVDDGAWLDAAMAGAGPRRDMIRIMSSEPAYAYRLLDEELLEKWTHKNPSGYGMPSLPLCAWSFTDIPLARLPAGSVKEIDSTGNPRLFVPGRGVHCGLCNKAIINYPYVVKNQYEPRWNVKLIGGECMIYATRSYEDALEACGL